MASVSTTQRACAVDFATRCGALDDDASSADGAEWGTTTLMVSAPRAIPMQMVEPSFFLSVSTLLGDDRMAGGDRRLSKYGPHGPHHHRRQLLHHGADGHGHHHDHDHHGESHGMG